MKNSMDNLIGKHVIWNKLKDKPDASMQEVKGFGVMCLLESNARMVISGDYGVTTSTVEKIIIKDNGDILVNTKNSIYLIKERK